MDSNLRAAQRNYEREPNKANALVFWNQIQRNDASIKVDREINNAVNKLRSFYEWWAYSFSPTNMPAYAYNFDIYNLNSIEIDVQNGTINNHMDKSYWINRELQEILVYENEAPWFAWPLPRCQVCNGSTPCNCIEMLEALADK